MSTLTADQVSKRLVSLDFLRGLIMVLLALESTGFYHVLESVTANRWAHALVLQFFHHPWHGLRFWDLVQPAFMFMSGTALALSLHRQQLNGVLWIDSFRKIAKRCAWLFFWGVLDYAVQPGGLSFQLSDVLTQLSFTTMVAFLIFRWSFGAQLLVCACLLLLTECLYRFTGIPGFDQPFVNQHNFGNYMELMLTGRMDPSGWVSINCIPTAVHTIAGAAAGKWLLSDRQKLMPLILGGIACWILGYGIDLAGITPIIKRIATSSFTIASLGWCLLFLAMSYWWIDVKGHRRGLQFFLVVGMNSLFIYLFFEIVCSRWFNGYIGGISYELLHMAGVSEWMAKIVASLSIFACEWGICYFLFTKKIFFKV